MPRMPTGPNPWPWKGHRQRRSVPANPVPAMVARKVIGKEKRENAQAVAALKKEWDRLRAINTWDEDHPEEYWTVVNRLKTMNRQGKFARIYDLCFEKKHELVPEDTRRKMKGRVVYGGDRVIDEFGAAAMFEDINSCPSTMAAAKSAYAFGLLKLYLVHPGHCIRKH